MSTSTEEPVREKKVVERKRGVHQEGIYYLFIYFYVQVHQNLATCSNRKDT